MAVAKAVCAGCPVRAECLEEALVRIPVRDRGRTDPRGAARAAPATSPTSRPSSSKPACALAPAAANARPPGGSCSPRADRSARSPTAAGSANAPPPAGPPAPAQRHTTSTAEGSAGGHRAPLLISHTHNPQAGTSNAGRTRTLMNTHRRTPTRAAQRRSGVHAWAETVEHQQDAARRHADFYALAGELVATLYALNDLTVVLAAQVGGYGQGRVLYDDTRTVDPAARLADAVQCLRDVRAALGPATAAANAFWSADRAHRCRGDAVTAPTSTTFFRGTNRWLAALPQPPGPPRRQRRSRRPRPGGLPPGVAGAARRAAGVARGRAGVAVHDRPPHRRRPLPRRTGVQQRAREAGDRPDRSSRPGTTRARARSRTTPTGSASIVDLHRSMAAATAAQREVVRLRVVDETALVGGREPDPAGQGMRPPVVRRHCGGDRLMAARLILSALLAVVAAAAAVLSFSALRDLALLCGFAATAGVAAAGRRRRRGRGRVAGLARWPGRPSSPVASPARWP